MRGILVRVALALVVLAPAAARTAPVTAPCRAPSANPMPHGASHDHSEPDQHRFACRMKAAAVDDASSVVPEPAEFGEIDVAGTVAVMLTTFRDAGFVVYDLSDPLAPRAVGRFLGVHCDERYDSNCGADVKLSPDGTTAFLATQTRRLDTVVELNPPPPEARGGIVVVDLTVPSVPRATSFVPVGRGVHMLAVHEIRGETYVFAVGNGVDDPVFRLTDGPARTLEKVGDIFEPGVHDFNAFTDGARAYLYASYGTGSLGIYDVTDPSSPRRVGTWRPRPDRRGETWYVHSAWTFRHAGRRYTAVVPELFYPGRYHGGAVGPVWLLDTTNHARPALIGTWRNPARRVAGNLGFSPHNVTMRGTLMALAHYHGGVWLLDWRDVIARRATSPLEVGSFVPHSVRREYAEPLPVTEPSGFDTLRRPSVWDAVITPRAVYASDMTGGLYTLVRT